MDSGFELPIRLQGRYVVLQSLQLSSHANTHHYLIGAANTPSSAPYMLKVTPLEQTNAHILDHLGKLNSPAISSPLEYFSDNGYFYQVHNYCPAGSLRDLMNNPSQANPGLLAVENLVRQLSAALAVLHEHTSGPILHCDIKPSNILVQSAEGGDLQFRLNDFDFSITNSTGVARPQRYTIEYAAPEVIAPDAQVGPALDYWSLGMLIYEWVTGSNPLFGRDRQKITERIISSGHEYFDVSTIDNTSIRALLGGLIDSDAATRWTYDEVNRWLAHDPDIIREGLARRGERFVSPPHSYGRYEISSLSDAGRALLWAGIRDVEDILALASWLQVNFDEAGDIALGLREIAANTSLESVELDFMMLAYRCWPGGRPIWRSFEVTRQSVLAACNRCLDEDENATSRDHSNQWLQSLTATDGPLDYFHARHESATDSLTNFKQAADLAEKIRLALTDFNDSWDAIAAEAGEDVAASRPTSPADYLPALIKSVLDPVEEKRLQDRLAALFSSELILFRENWFYTFGMKRNLSVPKIIILEQLEMQSRIGSIINIRSPDQIADLNMSSLQENIIRLDCHHFDDLAPLPDAEITHLEPGEEFEDSEDYRYWRLLGRRIWLTLNESRIYLGERIRDLLGRERAEATEDAAEETAPPVDNPELHRRFSTYLIPVGLRDDLGTFIELHNLYMVRISWSGESNRHINITLRKRRLFRGAPILSITRLPHQGHIVLLVHQSCRIHCYEKTGIFTTYRFAPATITIRKKLPGLADAHLDFSKDKEPTLVNYDKPRFLPTTPLVGETSPTFAGQGKLEQLRFRPTEFIRTSELIKAADGAGDLIQAETL